MNSIGWGLLVLAATMQVAFMVVSAAHLTTMSAAQVTIAVAALALLGMAMVVGHELLVSTRERR